MSEDAKNLVLQRFKEAERFQSPYRNIWRTAYKFFRSFTDKKNYAFLNNVFVPFSYIIIQSILARMVTAMFSVSPYVTVHPRIDKEKVIRNAKNMETLIDYTFYVEKARRKFEEWILDALIYGKGIIKHIWKSKDEMPEFYTVDPYDFYIDPMASSIKEADYCINRIYRSREYLIRMGERGIYQNIDKISPMESSFSYTQSQKEQRLQDIGLGQPIEEFTRNMIELLEYWEDNRVIVLANRNTIVRDEENEFSFKPFVELDDNIISREFYSIGEIEGQETQQFTLNELRNQYLDAVDIIINPMYLISRYASIDTRELVSRPGGWIFTNDVNAVRPLTPNMAVLSVGLQAQEILKIDMERRSGVYDVVRGEKGRGAEETATEVLQRGESANLRFRLKLVHLEDALSELGEQRGEMLRKFISESKVGMILREGKREFFQISPSDLEGKFLYTVQARELSEAQKIVLRREFGQLLPMAMQVPFLDQKELVKEFMRLLPIKDIDKFFIKEPPIPVSPLPAEVPISPAGEVSPRGVSPLPLEEMLSPREGVV